MNKPPKILMQAQLAPEMWAHERSTPEIRLYSAILQTFIDDAMNLRKRLDRIKKEKERSAYLTRRGVIALRRECGSKYAKDLCELLDLSHYKLIEIVNSILNGRH